ncbi:DUF2599 domain-containing protein [Nocardia blacklockiae]|uniref:DUF2599 domain-containing protein n=1 Tax=Nocardia blacklockiae TaxID=480036 RepID=UPI002B4AC3C3|nr:DUF2599 domain-containing protein [Nocardia blacklockiae]
MRHSVQAVLGASVLAAALAAAGCGSGDENPDPAPVPATTPALTTAPAPAAPSAPPTAAGPPTVDPYAGSALIEGSEWSEDPDGRRLRVYPSAAGRADTFPAALDRAWAEVVAAVPDADSPGMYDQFKCHWEWARLVAPDKPSWNLEPWRPALGYQGTVSARCNPGGPDPVGN